MGSDTKKIAGVAAAPMTGGASLALTASEMKKDKEKRKEERRRSAEEQARRVSALEEENKGLQKNLDIATRDKKKQGIASLVGGDQGSSTLG